MERLCECYCAVLSTHKKIPNDIFLFKLKSSFPFLAFILILTLKNVPRQ